MSQSVLQGTALPADECSTATIALFGEDDECSMSVQELFFSDNSTENNNSTESVILNLYNGDCPTRFLSYATACSEIFGDGADEVINILSVVHLVYN